MALAQHTGSYYAATANAAPERPALKGQISCDVCVIGAASQVVGSVADSKP